MKYEGIGTSELLKRNEKRKSLFFPLVIVLEVVGFILFIIEEPKLIYYLSAFLFFSAIFNAIICTYIFFYPGMLKNIHGRDDVPSEEFNGWMSNCEFIMGFMTVIPLNINLISNII
ncbi:hypothetical protein [Edaphovirga cremea]|uniref:hypothetical protein n=1 Tax=Edaphovirga cremea TaxID=2267246 RepID=UPI0039891811